MKKRLLLENVMKDASVLLIASFMVLSTALIVVGGSSKNIETVDDADVNTPIKSIEGTEIFSKLFERYTMTGIPSFGYYREGDTLRACVSADGGISWHVSGSNYSITIFSDPTCEITNPEDGDDVTGTVTITADASDDVGVSKVTFSIDSVEIGYDGSTPYSISWDTTSYSDGWHTITATAYDNEDNTGSDSINVCVGGDCDNHPPDIPSILNGPTTGEPDVQYSYTTSTTDPDGDMVQYGLNVNGDFFDWTGFYYSDTTCTINLTFNNEKTYNLKVKARDEHGAENDYSPVLTVIISEGCGDFDGFNVCPTGDAMLEFGETLLVHNLDDDYDDGIKVEIGGGMDVYRCEVEEVFDSTESSFTGVFTGTFNGSPFTLSMTIGENNPPTNSGALGIHPIGFNGSATGCPSIIAWVKEDDCEGSWKIVFRKKCMEVSDLGFISLDSTKSESLGIHPIGFNGSATGCPSIFVGGDECGDDFLWTCDEFDVSNLPIKRLMVAYVNECEVCHKDDILCKCELTPKNGVITDFTLYAQGVDEFTVSTMWAKKNVLPSIPTIDGPVRVKSGEINQYTITPEDDDGYVIILVDGGAGDEPQIEGIHPIGFNGSATGCPSKIDCSWDEEGEVVLGMRGIDEFCGYGPWATLSVIVPKNRAINTPFLNFLDNHSHLFPLLRQMLKL